MSKHIDHIEITNFKSIRHQKIEGCKRINVFIGYPNVGKSNILEAISALSYLQKDFVKPFSDLCRLRNPSELFFDSDIKSDINIKYFDSLYSFDKSEINIRYLSESKLDFAIGKPNTLAFESSNSKSSKRKSLLNIKKNLFFIKDASKSYDNLSVVDIVSNNIEEDSIINHDQIKVSKYQYLDSYYFPTLYHNQKTNGLSLFSPFGENLVDIVQFNKELRKEVSQMFRSNALKLSIDQGNNSIKGLKELDDETIFLIPFYQMADTLQRLIFHKAAIMSNQDTVLLFEEPEAHMFPPYISKFTGDIIHEKKNGNQYFISTHSPFVIGDFLEDARDELSIYVVGLKDGETIIKRLTDEQMHEVYQFGVDLFFNIEDYIK